MSKYIFFILLIIFSCSINKNVTVKTYSIKITIIEGLESNIEYNLNNTNRRVIIKNLMVNDEICEKEITELNIDAIVKNISSKKIEKFNFDYSPDAVNMWVEIIGKNSINKISINNFSPSGKELKTIDPLLELMYIELKKTNCK